MKDSPTYLFKSKAKRKAAALLDFVGKALVRPHLSALPGPRSPERILVIRLDHLGDVVMSRPALAALKKTYPSAKIDLLLPEEFCPLFESDPWVHRFIPVRHHWFNRNPSWGQIIKETKSLLNKLKNNQYDLAIDFRGDLRHILLMTLANIPERIGYGVTGGGFLLTRQGAYDKTFHQVELNLKLLDVLEEFHSAAQNYPFKYTESQKMSFLERFPELKSVENKRLILIHSGAGYPAKKWPLENFRRLIPKLIHKNFRVVLLGSKEERENDLFPAYSSLFDLRGRMTLPDLPILMDLADFYLGHDSGPAHIAAAQGISGIILFSGTNEETIWKPWSDQLTILSHKIQCSPCEAQVCPLKHHECMENISIKTVEAALTAHFGYESEKGKS